MTMQEAQAEAERKWGDLAVVMSGPEGTCYVGRWSSDLGCGGDFDCYGIGETFEAAFERVQPTPVVNP